MIDTDKMRKAVMSDNYRGMSGLFLGDITENEVYKHAPHAILALCDEVDRLREEIEVARAFLKPLLEE